LAVLAVALLTLPFVGSITPAPAHPIRAAPALAADLPDGELVRLLALHEGIPARHAPPLAVPPGATVPSLAQKLGARAGTPLMAADAARFATLDPRVAAPVLTLLVAVGQSWDLTDAAFTKLSPADRTRLQQLAQSGRDTDPEFQRLDAQVDKAALVNAAILLLDATEGIVIPALQDAIAAGAWPPAGVWDPVGVLRLGSTGNDVETLDRIVQIDPSGDDTYLNNAGGTTIAKTLSPPTPGYQVALSLDFEGNDVYRQLGYPAQGSGAFGVGVLEDFAGDDQYTCDTYCEGASNTGVGMLREYNGTDNYSGGDRSIGFGGLVGISRDDSGSDQYMVSGEAGGSSARSAALGLLWDRAGIDSYRGRFDVEEIFGYSASGGDGWFIDDGLDSDTYSLDHGPLQHACNSCSWHAGNPSVIDGKVHGIGLDNADSLGALLTEAYFN
jgi:hypothetical protein